VKDVFICHASEDQRLARSLWIRLSQYGVTAWLDEAEMNAGDVLVQKLAVAIHSARWFIALLTKHSVAKKWVTFELNQAMDREVREERHFILPVVADDCDIPMYLRNKVYVDIRERDQYDKGVAALIRAVRGDTQVLPADVVSADLGVANQDELYELPRWQFALETCLRNHNYIARTVRTLGAMANLLPKQVITYCEEAPHLAVCPTIDASGEIYYGLKTRILERYGTREHYGEEMALYLRSLRIHASPTYTVDELSYFLGFHELS
jgi:hypothetical protein